MDSCRDPLEDIISQLPDEILLQILSYLPGKDILKAFALSKRWNTLRSLHPRIFKFFFYAADDFLDYGSDACFLGTFHDRVKSFPDNSRMAEFCLQYTLLPDNQNHQSMLEPSLCDAARHQIEEMALLFEIESDPQDRPYHKVISLPHSLFTSDSLTSLELSVKCRLQELELPIEFPTSIWRLPSLRTLDIAWFEDWEKLILPGCPVLEELILRCSTNLRYIDIPIASDRLQILTIEASMPNDSWYSLEIKCPNLEYLNISYWDGSVQVCDLYSLAEADIDIDCSVCFMRPPEMWLYEPAIPEVLERLRHVQFLKLSSSTLEVIQFLHSHKEKEAHLDMDELPIFYNLTHLELEVCPRGLILVVRLLQKMPHLQSLKLCIGFGYMKQDMEQNCFKDVLPPACLEHCLETFSISSFGGTTKEEIDFLIYIFENAEVLEHSTVRWSKGRTSEEERMSIQQDLSTLFRSDCVYDFF